MSDSIPPSPSDPSETKGADQTPAAAPAPAPKKTKREPQPHSLKRRLRTFVLAVILIGAIFRLSIHVLLPLVANRVAAQYGVRCEYDRMALSFLGGTAYLWNFQILPKEGGDPILRADYLQGYISPLNLLRGRLVVWRTEADGVDVVAERTADGSIPLLTRLLAHTRSSAPPASSAAAPGTPIDLQIPLRIDAVRLSHVNVHFRDLSVAPNFETQVQATIRLSDIGSSGRPAKLEVDVGADPVLDSMQISGKIRNTADSIDADLSMLLRGLHPKPAAAYLLPLGLEPIADQITVRAGIKLSVHASANSPDLSATFSLNDIIAIADDRPCASLKTLSLDASSLNGATLKLGQLLLEHGDVSLERSTEGRLQFGGVELAAAAPASSAKGRQPAPVASAANPFAGLNFPGINAQLQEIRLNDMQLSLTDQSFVPAIVSSAKLDVLSLKNIVLDPSRVSSPVMIAGTMSVPGIIRAITIKGQASPVAATKKLSLAVTAEGIRPDGAKPYLDRAEVASSLVDGSLTAQIGADAGIAADGTLSADLNVANVELADRGKALMTMPKFELGGQVKWLKVATAPKTQGALTTSTWEPQFLLHVANVQGPDLTIRRDADGALAGLGFRLLPRKLRPGEHAANGRQTVPALSRLPEIIASLPIIQLPYFAVDSATWTTHVLIEDEAGVLDKPVLCSFAGELHHAKYTPHPRFIGKETGQFAVHLGLPGVMDRIDSSGSLTQLDGGLGINASFRGTGFTCRAVEPYLKNLGIVPVLTDGQIESQIEFDYWTQGWMGEATYLTFEFGPTALRDAGVDVARLENAGLGPVIIQPTGITIEDAEISQPQLAVKRNHDGTFSAFGMRLEPRADPAKAPTPPAGIDAPPALHLPTCPIPVLVDLFKLNDGHVDWNDEVPTPAVKTSLGGSVSLSGINLTAGAPPAGLHASGSILGTIDRATADGTVSLAPDAPAADLSVDVEGIRTGPLSAYWPAGVSSTFRQGLFKAALSASAKNNPAGGIAARLSVRDLSLTDRSPATDWADVGQFTINASRIDPAKGVIAFDAISSHGVSATVRRLADGGIEAAGLRVEARAPATTPPPQQPPDQASKAAPPGQATPSAVNVEELVAAARRPLPLVSIDRLDLQADRLTIDGAVDPNGAPLSLVNARLHAPGPIAVGGPKASGQPPVQLTADGALAPIAGHFALNLSASPCAPEPSLKMDLKAQGISGQGMIDVMPELGAVMKGKELTDGTLTTHVYASVNYQRRGPRDFDLSRGFVANFMVNPLQYRQTADGPVIAGFQSLHGEGISVKPMTGDVRMKLIEMTTPIGRFYRDADGLHALGMVIPLDTESSKPPAPKEKISAEAEPATAPAPPAHHAPPIRPASEIRLDRFTISGIDLVLEDRTTSPITEIPLKTLDVEINDVSNQMPWTGEQARFSVLCTSDKVWLPARKGETSSATTRTASGEYLEQRDLFSEITAMGKVGIRYRPDGSPVLDGWAKTAIDGFELLGVRGEAQQFKVNIGGGVFDDTNDIRFEPDGIKTQNQLVFTNLSLSEPANGPLQSGFKIPVPIDVAIGLVTDADGSITLNLPVPIKNGAISVSDVYLPAIGAVGGVLGTAVASAPAKAAGAVLDIFGGGKKAGSFAPQIIRVPFLPGYADVLDPGEQQVVAQIAQRMNDDPNLQIQIAHELSSADADRSALRANPTPAECLVLADRLRRQKERLLSRRAQLAAAARGEIPSQSPAVPATLAELRDVDRSLAAIESSLDQLYDLLRPGAAAQSSRRTRAASLDLARARMDAIRNALAAGDRSLLDRIHLTVPQSAVAADAPSDPQAGGSVVLTLVSKRH